jgi:hypothetical protein
MQACRRGPRAGAIFSTLLLCGTMALAEAGAPMEQMRQTLDALVAIFADTALNSPDRAPERRAKSSRYCRNGLRMRRWCSAAWDGIGTS